jgi:YesN/AraC family two-component response regulator
MQSREYTYWLQGFFELTDATTLTAKQIDLLERHLQLVFKYEIDPEIPTAAAVEKEKSLFDFDAFNKTVEAMKAIDEHEKQKQSRTENPMGGILVRC